MSKIKVAAVQCRLNDDVNTNVSRVIEHVKDAARRGAQVVVIPELAIGSEPMSPDFDTKDQWQRAMIGHAVCNVVPVIAANRIGDEDGQRFYGSSFIADHLGDKAAEMGREDEGAIVAELDLEMARREQAAFGFFRDRRPEIYEELDPAASFCARPAIPESRLMRSGW